MAMSAQGRFVRFQKFLVYGRYVLNTRQVELHDCGLLAIADKAFVEIGHQHDSMDSLGISAMVIFNQRQHPGVSFRQPFAVLAT